jgi:LPS sulfotransferase NodH
MFWHYRRTVRRVAAPVFIVAAPRSGSGLLLSYLNSIPGVGLCPEILHPRMYYGVRSGFISKRSVFRHIVHSVHYGTEPVRGAKFLSTQLERHRLEIPDLRGLFPAPRFIVLYRESLLEQHVSLKTAERTGVWS